MEYIQQAESRLKNPQAKRDHKHSATSNIRPPNQITYREIPQAQTRTTQCVSVQDTEGTTTTTTTRTSQTVTALMEARFQGLESEMRNQKEQQLNMDHRLSHLENKTSTINNNIAAMMAHWQINPTQKRRAISILPNQDQTHYQTYTDSPSKLSLEAGSEHMDQGEMEEW